MKTNILFAALAACTLAAVTGCRTPPPPPPPPPPVYEVVAKAESPDASMLAAGVALDVRGALVRSGYPILAQGAAPDRGAPVVSVDIAFARRTTSALDVWRVYEGTAKVKVVDNRRFLRGEKSFAATGRRADNEAEAVAGVRAALSASINAWLAEVLPNAHPAKR